MNRREFLSKTGKGALAGMLLPYVTSCGIYEGYELPLKSGVVLQRPIDGKIDIKETKNLLIENPEIYDPDELIFDIINESYFSFFNSEIPEILTVDYDTKEEMRNLFCAIPTAYYERITKTIHILQGFSAIQNINHLFHELGHYIEHIYGNGDKNEHLSETIEFALGLESLLLFPELTEIQPKIDYYPNNHPFFDNLPHFNFVGCYNYNHYGDLDPGYDSYIMGATTAILYLDKNKGDIQKTVEDILKTPTAILDQNAVEFLKQDIEIRKNFNNDTFGLLIENVISPRIPYDEKNNEYYNTIIYRINTWISKKVLEEGHFIQYLR